MFSGKMPNCKKCGFVKIIPENFEVMHVIEKYLPHMMDGFSGTPDIFKILKIMELEDLEERKDLLEKVLFYINCLTNIKHEPKSQFQKKTHYLGEKKGDGK